MKWMLTGVLCVLLWGCATPAYKAVKQECLPAAFADYPPNLLQTLENRQRLVHVSTGLQSCVSRTQGRILCQEMTRPEWVTSVERVVVDQNEAVRNSAIASCTANLCLQRYGNADCKTDQLLVPVR